MTIGTGPLLWRRRALPGAADINSDRDDAAAAIEREPLLKSVDVASGDDSAFDESSSGGAAASGVIATTLPFSKVRVIIQSVSLRERERESESAREWDVWVGGDASRVMPRLRHRVAVAATSPNYNIRRLRSSRLTFSSSSFSTVS
jgi:hypothetical protein